ncbi:MAG: ATP-dependent DNA helicase RecG [Parcubacteria group bacterium]|nr:ATP-dependent DNA helicase RecG [Parcubacteria group bacterium]
MNLESSIKTLTKIGPAVEKRLNRLGIKTIRDLLWHFPHRYEDFSNQKNIADLVLGETASIKAKIIQINTVRTWKKRMILTEALLEDQTGQIKAIWFNQPYLAKTFLPGLILSLSGKTAFRDEELYLSNPAYENALNNTHTARLAPIYPETQGLSSRWLRTYIRSLLPMIKSIPDPLPNELKQKTKIIDLPRALNQIHFPKNFQEAEIAKRRFAFEELFFIQLAFLKNKHKLAQEKSPQIPINIELIKKFLKTLPFELTPDQKNSLWEIIQDLNKPYPMNRLLQGDVGSGKTIVALAAAMAVLNQNYRAVLMSPTEILAQQHFKTAKEIMARQEKKYSVGIATSSKKENLDAELLIGTHALISQSVNLKNIGLVIIDEQHRFGVSQRHALIKSQKLVPHFLSMSATPIPRTVALAVWGDLDISLIKEMPKARKKIITKIVPPEKRKAAYDFIRKEIEANRQVFVICPRIEEKIKENFEDFMPRQASWDDLLMSEVKAVKNEYKKLSGEIFPDLKIAMLHGQLKSKEKEAIMKKFTRGEIQILVSTSVVEVGIDIPNASIMMIEGAEHFGLAQLHQFRGRVGRGPHQSYCFLLTESPAKNSMERLKALEKFDSGFDLAERDLVLRGPGDLAGVRQSGLPDLAMASLKDIDLIKMARESALKILKSDPVLKNYPLLQKGTERFQKILHLE